MLNPAQLNHLTAEELRQLVQGLTLHVARQDHECKRVANSLPLYQWGAISGCQRCGSNSATLLAG